MAIRRALGAGKRQVIKEVITETMMLSLAGALLGLWLGEAGIRLIGRLGR